LNENGKINAPSQEAAKRIYQEVLDQLSDAVMVYNPAALIDNVHFPFRMSTLGRDFVIESQHDWLKCAVEFRNSLRALGVNHYIRLVTEADFLSENYIEGRHVTHTLRDAKSVIPSYENRAILTRVNGQWKVSQLDSAMENSRWPIDLPKVTEKAKPIWDDTDPARDIRCSSASPKALYQDYLNRLTRTNMENDFDGWCEMCEFPHTVHIEHIDTVIEEPENIRPFFDMVRGIIDKYAVDRFNRSAEKAEFLSATQICGYHSTTLSAKGDLKVGPVAGRFILKRSGTQWRMTSVTNSVTNAEFPYSLPEFGDRLISLRDIQERTTRQ